MKAGAKSAAGYTEAGGKFMGWARGYVSATRVKQKALSIGFIVLIAIIVGSFGYLYLSIGIAAYALLTLLPTEFDVMIKVREELDAILTESAKKAEKKSGLKEGQRYVLVPAEEEEES